MAQDGKPMSWLALALELGISFLITLLIIVVGVLHIVLFPIVIAQMVSYYREAKFVRGLYEDYKNAVASVAEMLGVDNTLEAVDAQFDRIASDARIYPMWSFACWKSWHINNRLAMSFPWGVSLPARALYSYITHEIVRVPIDPQKERFIRPS